jgi:hypothetical protein
VVVAACVVSEEIVATLSIPAEPGACLSCGNRIDGRPGFDVDLPFCCSGCASDGRCECPHDANPSDTGSIRHCLDISAVFAVARPGRPESIGG